MIYPKRNNIIFWIFKWYVKRIVRNNFNDLLIPDHIQTSDEKSILLIANHFSFWDSLILFCVINRLFNKKAYVMVLEDTMHKQPFLKYAGAFSVGKHSKSVLASINYAADLLNNPGNLVLMFPQGKLYPNFVEHIQFEKGIARVINQSKEPFQLVFAATFVQYFKHKKPTATVYLKTEDVNYAANTVDELQSAYQRHYNSSKLKQTEIDIEQ